MLNEVNPESLQELFNKNPKDMTDDEWRKIVEVLRAQRKQWLEQESRPKKKTPARPDLKIEDLDI